MKYLRLDGVTNENWFERGEPLRDDLGYKIKRVEAKQKLTPRERMERMRKRRAWYSGAVADSIIREAGEPVLIGERVERTV